MAGLLLSIVKKILKFEGLSGFVALNRYMKPIDTLEQSLSKLALAARSETDFESFRSGVWREIRHRRAVVHRSTLSSSWSGIFFDFELGRLAFGAVCLSVFVGVALGIWGGPVMSNSRIASRNLDLGVFSNSANGLPSNFLVSHK